MSELAFVRNAQDVSAHAGEVVRVIGIYQVSDISPRKVMHELPSGELVKSSKVVRLALEDGSGVRLWVRPDEEMSAHDGAKVVAVGKLVAPEAPGDPNMARPGEAPSLVDIERVDAHAE